MFFHKPSFVANQRLEETKVWMLFGYVQCNIEVSEASMVSLANYLPVFGNNLVSTKGKSGLMKEFTQT